MVKIIADSTCDLSEELKNRYDIGIIPLHIILDEKDYEDGVDITPDEIYEWADANKTTPKTAAPSIDHAMEVMSRYADEESEIVCFTISSEMSTSANVMQLAAEELGIEDRVYVIDSRNLSTGIGLLVIEAAVMARSGMKASDIRDRIMELIPCVRASFVVDTLVYLYRGGRCSGLSALVGSALKLHPRIQVSAGTMSAGKKYRGRMPGVVADYVKDMEGELLKAKRDRVFITHAGCDEAIISSVKKYLEDLGRFDEICITRAGGVISSHCGYGTLGVLFIEEDR